MSSDDGGAIELASPQGAEQIARLIVAHEEEHLSARDRALVAMYDAALADEPLSGNASQQQWMRFFRFFIRLRYEDTGAPNGLVSKMAATIDALNRYIPDQASSITWWPDEAEFDMTEAYQLQVISSLRDTLVKEYTEWSIHYSQDVLPTVEFVRRLYLVYARLRDQEPVGATFRRIWEGEAPPPLYISPSSYRSPPPSYFGPPGGPEMGTLGHILNSAR